MKRIVWGSACVLFIVGLYFSDRTRAARIESLWANSRQANQAAATYSQQETSFIEVSDQGTLRVVRNRAGQVIFDENHPAGEGFALSYQSLDNDSRLPSRTAPPHIVTAVNERFSESLRLCPDCKKQSATQVITVGDTSDNVLRITTRFLFDEQDGTLKIQRIVQNISNHPVELLYLQVQYDPKLRERAATTFKLVRKLKQPLAAPSSDTARENHEQVDRALFERVFSLPCEACPPWCDFNLEKLSTSDGYFCPVCESESQLVWDVLFTQGGTPPTNCKNPIRLNVLRNGYVEVSQSGKAFALKRGMKICVECLKDETTGMFLPLIAGSVGTSNLECKQFTLSNGATSAPAHLPRPAAILESGQGMASESILMTEGN